MASFQGPYEVCRFTLFPRFRLEDRVALGDGRVVTKGDEATVNNVAVPKTSVLEIVEPLSGASVAQR